MTKEYTVEELINYFEAYNSEVLAPYRELISTKEEDGSIYPPYIPHVGKDYSKYGILMYGMAQNISKPWDALVKKSRREKVMQMKDAKKYTDIAIAPYEVMLALAGLYIYAKFGDVFYKFQEIHESIAVSNYYKFSLNNGSDINPNREISQHMCAELYWSENDKLASKELQELKPNTLIFFGGRHESAIKKSAEKCIKINDPSWVLQGGGGHLKTLVAGIEIVMMELLLP